jgi:zeaxanthin glucosyltransferase
MRNLDLVAMHLGMPYVHINCALHPDYTGITPLYVYDWPHEGGPEARARNLAGVQALAPMLEPFQRVVKEYVDHTGLPLDLTDPYAAFSKRALLTQTPEEFDFPSDHWPPHFHYTGPWHEPAFRPQVPFPWDQLTGEIIIYASMGTLLNGSREVFRTIVEAAYAPGRQLVLSIGAHLTAEDLGDLPANTIVVNHAPQLEILQRANLCITHAGLNTVLEALAQGVPLVAIPVAYDQPGVAARIKCSRTGLYTPLRQLTLQGLRQQVDEVLHDPVYREQAQRLRNVIQERNGLHLAADFIEDAFGHQRRKA